MPDQFGGVEVEETTVPQASVDQFGGVAVVDAEEPGFLDKAYGAGEVVAQIGSGIVGDIAGGIAGTATALATQDSQKGVDVLRDIQDAITLTPQTQAGKDMLQSVGNIEVLKKIAEVTKSAENKLADAGFETNAGPLRTALAVAFPTAIGELLGAKLPGTAAKLSRRAADKAEAQATELKGEAESIAEDARILREEGPQIAEEAAEIPQEVTDAGLAQTAENIASGKDAEIVKSVQADPEFYRAAEELGLSTEPLASFASQNPQFRALEQGLAAVPASMLDAQSKKFVTELSQKADDLIKEYGGTLDKAELSQRFRSESLANVDDLAEQADRLYDTLDQAIPKSARVATDNTIAFINKKADELGGSKELPPLLKKLKRSLGTTKKTETKETFSPIFGAKTETKTKVSRPTHERLSQLRKEVGQAIGKHSGPFKNAEAGLLKQVYAVLRKDQDAAAAKLGVEDVSNAANALVKQRKQIEDNLAKTLGKDLSGSLLPKVGRSVKQLAKGEVQQFNSLMEKIPQNMRKEVVVSSLNDIFRGSGVNKQALDVTQFSKFMDDLNRSPQLKSVLFRELPEESQRALLNLAKVSKGISTALQDKIPTGRIAAFFDENEGFLSKMMGRTVSTLAAAKGGPILADAVSELLSGKGKGSKAQVASEFMASPKFQSIIRDAVKEGVTEGNQISEKLIKAEKLMKKNKKYKKWAKTLDESQAAKLASVGLVSYLLAPPEREPQP